MSKKAVLLINVGTPDKPDKKHVRKYLRQFLNDRLVIDLPWLLQKILVNLIIIPFRTRKSTALYRRLWDKDGSPLLYHMKNLVFKLYTQLGNNYAVFGAMRYGNPSIAHKLIQIKEKGCEDIIVIPLYPQYAESITLSAKKKVSEELKRLNYQPNIHFIEHFYNNEGFINAFTTRIKAYNPENFDHIVFSYHGLPLRHIQKIHPEKRVEKCTCETQFPEDQTVCYKAACYETTRLLIEKLALPAGQFSISFQSRITKNWLSPFTDQMLINLATTGTKKVLVVAPSFVADCLETKVEIEQDYQALFIKNGGEKLVMVESLNDSDEWVKAIATMIEKVD